MKCELESARVIPKKIIFKNKIEDQQEEEIGVKYQTAKDFFKKK